MRRWRMARIAVPTAAFALLVVATWKTGAWPARTALGEAMRASLVVLPFALFEIVTALRDRWKAWARAGWPVAQGTVLKSEAWFISMRHGTDVEIVCAFEADGRSRTATLSEHYGWPFGDPDKLAARFPPGATVPVRFKPDDPAIAMLDISTPAARLRLNMALAVVAVLMLMLWMGWLEEPSAAPP